MNTTVSTKIGIEGIGLIKIPLIVYLLDDEGKLRYDIKFDTEKAFLKTIMSTRAYEELIGED